MEESAAPPIRPLPPSAPSVMANLNVAVQVAEGVCAHCGDPAVKKICWSDLEKQMMY